MKFVVFLTFDHHPLLQSQKAAKRHSTRRLQDLAPDSNVGVSQVKKPKLGGSTDCDTPPKVSSPKFDLNCLTPRSRSKKLAKMKENVSKSKLGTPKVDIEIVSSKSWQMSLLIQNLKIKSLPGTTKQTQITKLGFHFLREFDETYS